MAPTTQSSQASISLHVWPGRWDLPSFDPLCLAAVLYLQLAVPGQFTVIECSNPDASPTGQLPFLVHDRYTVSSFPSIIKYVAGLQNADFKTYPKADLDSGLSSKERAQKIAWHAHAESHLGDLVYHYMYSNQDNWKNLTANTLSALFPVPQKYYVPDRIRASYHERLLVAGLWRDVAEETPAESPFPRDVKPEKPKKEELANNPTVSRAFDREKVLQKVHTELDIYQQLLHGQSFIFHNRLSSVDVLVAAHILLLVDPPYPDLLIKNAIVESYPALLSHARAVYDAALGGGKSLMRGSPPSFSVWDVIPSWPKGQPTKPEPSTPEDLQYTRIRWGFFGLALGSLVAYFAVIMPRPSPSEWQSHEVHNHGDEDDD